MRTHEYLYAFSGHFILETTSDSGCLNIKGKRHLDLRSSAPQKHELMTINKFLQTHFMHLGIDRVWMSDEAQGQLV